VEDPGFVYVDYNNDGLYSTDDGDIGATSGVDINALIFNDGVFETFRSEGDYHAPCRSVSLVVPASQSLSLTVPLRLEAGYNLIVHGALSAPSITLQACRNVNLAGSFSTFDTKMKVSAGCTVTLDGAIAGASGLDMSSELRVCAGRVVYANMAPILLADALIAIGANCSAYFDAAVLATTSADSLICVGAYGTIQSVNGSAMSSGGAINVHSCGGRVSLLDNDLVGTPIAVSGGDDVNITDSAMTSLDSSICLWSCDQVIGNSTNTTLSSGSLSAKGGDGVDLSSAFLVTTSGAVDLQSCGGQVRVNSSTISAAGGFSAYARWSVLGTGLSLNADLFARFISDCSKVTLNSSVINPFGSATDTSIYAKGRSTVNADDANWNVPFRITLRSDCSIVTARNALLQVSRLDGLVRFLAYGGTIDVTGATISGPSSFGPPGVNVIGP